MKDYKEAIESIMKDTTSKVMDHAIKAYRQGYEDGQKEKPQAIYEMKVEEYNKGLNEAWECAKKLCQSEKYGGFQEHCAEIFGREDVFDVFDYSASQCIEKVKAYQKRKIYSNHTTEEIAESFIKDVSAVKDQLPEHIKKCCYTCKYSRANNNDNICKYYKECLTDDKKEGVYGFAYSKYEPKQTDDEIKVGYEVYNVDPENKRIVTAIDGDKAIQLCSNGKYAVDSIDTLRWTGREDLRIKKVLENITNEI